jgi:large subunit ribosomal protein L7/L12
MSDITNEDVVKALGNLSVLEIIALTRQLEAQWGVEAKPQLVQGPQQKQGETQESGQTEFLVILASVPVDKKMNVIKAVREILVLGLKESKELVEAAPKTIMENASKEDAENLKNKLTEAGAVIEVK